MPIKEDSLRIFAGRLAGAKARKDGYWALRFPGGGDYYINCKGETAALTREKPAGEPKIEIIGDSGRVISILEGSKEPRAQFLAGGFRVRGDLKHLSNIAVELGILSKPIR